MGHVLDDDDASEQEEDEEEGEEGTDPMQVTTRCSHPIKLFRRHQAQCGRHYALESTQFVVHTAMYCDPIL